MAQTYRQVAKSVADRKAEHPELYCAVRGCLWHTAKLNDKRDGYILNANPCRKHPVASEAEQGQCEACGASVPEDELRTAMPAAGVEGSFCAECRGQERQ